MSDRYGHPRQSIFGRRHASAAATVSYSTSQHPSSTAAVPPPSSGVPAHGPGTATATTTTTTAAMTTTTTTSSGSTGSTNSVRRNLFQSQLTRRPGIPNDMVGGRFDGTGDEVAEDRVDRDEEDDDIVVRDKNGEVELDEPPNLVVDDPDEIVLDMRQENEKERQRLADAVKHHQINQHSVPAQPEELLEAVRASLRAKVAALAEDNWMYEKEDEPRLM